MPAASTSEPPQKRQRTQEMPETEAGKNSFYDFLVTAPYYLLNTDIIYD
jgi:hypothetical protein